MNATLAKLKECPKPPWQPLWPPGTKQPLTPQIAQRFFDLLSTSTSSLLDLLRANPELPPYHDLNSWRCNNKNGFADLWRKAREAQAEFLAQRCLDLARNTTPKNAHAQRLKFDIYRHLSAKFYPAVYGDKPTQPQTTVNVGVTVSAARLDELRAKLDDTRRLYLSNPNATTPNRSNGIKESRAREH
jgi:hypothetical protein